jgi:hypothetical protein
MLNPFDSSITPARPVPLLIVALNTHIRFTTSSNPRDREALFGIWPSSTSISWQHYINRVA